MYECTIYTSIWECKYVLACMYVRISQNATMNAMTGSISQPINISHIYPCIYTQQYPLLVYLMIKRKQIRKQSGEGGKTSRGETMFLTKTTFFQRQCYVQSYFKLTLPSISTIISSTNSSISNNSNSHLQHQTIHEHHTEVIDKGTDDRQLAAASHSNTAAVVEVETQMTSRGGQGDVTAYSKGGGRSWIDQQTGK